jgi:hypothetical protein
MVKQVLKEMFKLSPAMKFGRKVFGKEEFGEYSSEGSPLGSFLYTVMIIVAFYLAFKCHGRFDLVQFLLACCCAPFYIAYRLAVPCVKALS